MFRSVDLLQLLLRIETYCPLNEATAVFMLKNLCYHHTSHSDEPLSYQACVCTHVCVSVCGYACVCAHVNVSVCACVGGGGGGVAK